MSEIVSSQKEGVNRLAFNRPEKKNAITVQMYSDLSDAFDQGERQGDVRVHLITGSKGCFTAGNDLHDFLENPPHGESSPVLRFLRTISQLSKPLVAAVEGPAVGIGTTLLLHCDLVYAADNALFQMPFVNLGLVPEAASSLLLPSRIGHQRASQLLMLGEAFDASRAAELGLVNAVVGGNQLESLVEGVLARLAQQPAEALRQTKRLLKHSEAEAIQERIGEEAQLFVRLVGSDEARQVMAAFFRKNSP